MDAIQLSILTLISKCLRAEKGWDPASAYPSCTIRVFFVRMGDIGSQGGWHCRYKCPPRLVSVLCVRPSPIPNSSCVTFR